MNLSVQFGAKYTLRGKEGDIQEYVAAVRERNIPIEVFNLGTVPKDDWAVVTGNDDIAELKSKEPNRANPESAEWKGYQQQFKPEVRGFAFGRMAYATPYFIEYLQAGKLDPLSGAYHFGEVSQEDLLKTVVEQAFEAGSPRKKSKILAGVLTVISLFKGKKYLPKSEIIGKLGNRFPEYNNEQLNAYFQKLVDNKTFTTRPIERMSVFGKYQDTGYALSKQAMKKYQAACKNASQ